MLFFSFSCRLNVLLLWLTIPLFFVCGNEKISEKIEPVTGITFTHEPFEPDFDWKGKTVLLESFTGSECPPCLGIALALDGLLESYGDTYLAILEYHVNIPAPDPMENRYSHLRRFEYDVYRVPMTFFDGEEKFRGGGNDTTAYRYYQSYYQELKSRLEEEPLLTLQTETLLVNDNLIIADITVSNQPENTKYIIVLVENDVDFLGKNRIKSHQKVVRKLEEFVPDEQGSARHKFDIRDITVQNEKWLTTLEKNYSPFTFRKKMHNMSINSMQIVVFAQDTITQKIHNAYVSDITQ